MAAPLFEMVELEPELRAATLVEREWLTPGYLRFRLEGEPLRDFTAPGADDHVRLFFPPAEVRPQSLDQWREFPSREYTPVTAAPDLGSVEFEVVVHGDGPGSSWAAGAPLGSSAGVAGPRRTMRAMAEPDHWFLAGDESAFPAIRRFLQGRRASTPATVLLAVQPVNRDLAALIDRRGVDLEVIEGGSAALGERLAALTPADRPLGSVLAFVAGKSSLVSEGRDLLGRRWGLPQEATIVKGYWRD